MPQHLENRKYGVPVRNMGSLGKIFDHHASCSTWGDSKTALAQVEKPIFEFLRVPWGTRKLASERE